MKKQHSILGIASFVIGLGVPVLFALIIYSQMDIALLLAVILLVPIGFLSGLIALFFKDRKQIFSTIGIAINLFWICSIIYSVQNFHWRMF